MEFNFNYVNYYTNSFSNSLILLCELALLRKDSFGGLKGRYPFYFVQRLFGKPDDFGSLIVLAAYILVGESGSRKRIWLALWLCPAV